MPNRNHNLTLRIFAMADLCDGGPSPTDYCHSLMLICAGEKYKYTVNSHSNKVNICTKAELS